MANGLTMPCGSLAHPPGRGLCLFAGALASVGNGIPGSPGGVVEGFLGCFGIRNRHLAGVGLVFFVHGYFLRRSLSPMPVTAPRPLRTPRTME